MHKLNVLILGPDSLISTLNELKPFLKFNPLINKPNFNHEVILFFEDVLKDKKKADLINKSNSLKICASTGKNLSNEFDATLELPTSLKEINASVENLVAKKKFSKNSSIQIKKYLLNKNEKKLFKEKTELILTEKEIQLIELFIENKKPILKEEILSKVWNYSSGADTHTVETHIYRLRKKINDRFSDEEFIHNNKNGYYF